MNYVTDDTFSKFQSAKNVSIYSYTVKDKPLLLNHLINIGSSYMMLFLLSS